MGWCVGAAAGWTDRHRLHRCVALAPAAFLPPHPSLCSAISRALSFLPLFACVTSVHGVNWEMGDTEAVPLLHRASVQAHEHGWEATPQLDVAAAEYRNETTADATAGRATRSLGAGLLLQRDSDAGVAADDAEDGADSEANVRAASAPIPRAWRGEAAKSIRFDSAWLHEHGPLAKTAFAFTLFNFLADLGSVGTLSTPLYLQQTGVWLSLIAIPFFCGTGVWTLWIVYQASMLHPEAKDFPALNRVAWGRYGKVVLIYCAFLRFVHLFLSLSLSLELSQCNVGEEYVPHYYFCVSYPMRCRRWPSSCSISLALCRCLYLSLSCCRT